LVGWQAAPSTQVTHLPAWQTMPVPHDVPFGLSAFSVQTPTPVAHTSAATLHAFVVVHAVPAAHAVQAPLLHTMPVPQTMPFDAFPVSMHDSSPDTQTVCPTWQMLLG
jgi:hypothetical protein